MKSIVRGFTCFGFIAASFATWGALNAFFGSSTGPSNGHAEFSSQSVTSERELILKNAQKVSDKNNQKEENVILNDPNISEKWGLARTNATKAWEVSQGSKDIIVAVIDTGADVNHRDLQENLWVNPGESGRDKNGNDKATNRIDDDGNGFIDDVNGWNFVTNTNNVTDTHGHGTHIAGIIGARGGNSFGISGVSPRVSLMILKYYDPNTNNLENTIRAIRYAVKMKANIINYSGGGVEYAEKEFQAIKEAEANGVLFVSAAGNERSNSDEKGKHYFPADYDLSNIISVTAINNDTQVLASSNYGVRTVDLAAPGENIYSTLPGNSFGLMTGTSQATAFVTGVAALVMSHNREFSAAEVKKYILKTGDEHQNLLAKTGTSKVLNSLKALTSLDANVAVSGVIASNTATIPKKAFSSDSLRDPKLAPSAFNTGASSTEETTEQFAGFGKELLRALRNETHHKTEVLD